MTRLKKYSFASLLCLSGVACLVSYRVIGSYVDENGILIEPFALIPLFWIFQLLAVAVFAITFFKK